MKDTHSSESDFRELHHGDGALLRVAVLIHGLLAHQVVREVSHDLRHVLLLLVRHLQVLGPGVVDGKLVFVVEVHHLIV